MYNSKYSLNLGLELVCSEYEHKLREGKRHLCQHIKLSLFTKPALINLRPTKLYFPFLFQSWITNKYFEINSLMSWSYIQQQIQNATKQRFEITDITRSGVTFTFLDQSTGSLETAKES